MKAARSRDVLAPVPRDVDALVFDTDGVITDSAKVHAATWKTARCTFPAEHPPEDPGPRRPGRGPLRYGADIAVPHLGELLDGGVRR
jgi:hypothetical protein